MVYWLAQKITKIVAITYDFWSQSVPEMLKIFGFARMPLKELTAHPPDAVGGFGGRFSAGTGEEREGTREDGRGTEERDRDGKGGGCGWRSAPVGPFIATQLNST